MSTDTTMDRVRCTSSYIWVQWWAGFVPWLPGAGGVLLEDPVLEDPVPEDPVPEDPVPEESVAVVVALVCPLDVDVLESAWATAAAPATNAPETANAPRTCRIRSFTIFTSFPRWAGHVPVSAGENAAPIGCEPPSCGL